MSSDLDMGRPKTKAEEAYDERELSKARCKLQRASQKLVREMWDFEWQVQHISIGVFNDLQDACRKAGEAENSIQSTRVVKGWPKDEDGKYHVDGRVLESHYPDWVNENSDDPPE